jgi:glycerol kinase
MGAAYMAGLQIKYWKNIDEIKKIAIVDKEFESQISEEQRTKLVKGWDQAVSRTLNWTKDIE